MYIQFSEAKKILIKKELYNITFSNIFLLNQYTYIYNVNQSEIFY